MAGWPTCWTADPSVTKFQFLDCHQLFQHLCRLLCAHLAFMSTGRAKVIMHTEDPMLIFYRRFNHLWHGAMVVFTSGMVLRSLCTLKNQCPFSVTSVVVLGSCVLTIPYLSLSRRFNYRLQGNTPLFRLNVWLGIHWSFTVAMVLAFMANMAASPQAFETEYYWTF